MYQCVSSLTAPLKSREPTNQTTTIVNKHYEQSPDIAPPLEEAESTRLTTCVFDIETAPIDRETILADAEPFDCDSVKTGNRKDPVLVAGYVMQQKARYERDLVEKAALDARTGIVLCAGFYYPEKDEFSIIEGEEKSVLSEFWLHVVYPGRYIGFNISSFDLPFVIRRSWHHGIPVPGWIWDGRYFHRSFTDLMAYWRLGAHHDNISLDKFARFLGLGGKSHTGKDFANLYAANPQKAIEYIKTDLGLTTGIARMIQLL